MQKRFTVREAARATGVARTTIQRAVRTGGLIKGKDGLIALPGKGTGYPAPSPQIRT
jgi:hypothetical protein